MKSEAHTRGWSRSVVRYLCLKWILTKQGFWWLSKLKAEGGFEFGKFLKGLTIASGSFRVGLIITISKPLCSNKLDTSRSLQMKLNSFHPIRQPIHLFASPPPEGINLMKRTLLLKYIRLLSLEPPHLLLNLTHVWISFNTYHPEGII